MRNRWRVLAFDILAPVAAVVALVYIGVALAWPLWWVSVLFGAVPADRRGRRRQLRVSRAVTVSPSAPTTTVQDCGWPSSRVATVALVAARHRRLPAVDGARPHAAHNDTAEVVGIASSVSEASATFTPQSPDRVGRPGHGDDVAQERRGLQERDSPMWQRI